MSKQSYEEANGPVPKGPVFDENGLACQTSGPIENVSGPTTSALDQLLLAEQAKELEKSNEQAMSAKDQKEITDIPKVDLEYGTQKYVLVRCTNPFSGDRVYFVRGRCDAAYHHDAGAPLVAKLVDRDYMVKVTGGGRIMVSNNEVHIYGHSIGYGLADHSITAEMCKAHYGEGYNVHWDNDGY